MLPSIIAVLILAAITGGGVFLGLWRKKHGSRDYSDFFQENERKR